MESIKVELSLINDFIFNPELKRYPNYTFMGEYTIEGAKCFKELKKYESLGIEEVGFINSPDSLRVSLTDGAIGVAIFAKTGIIMEFRLYLDSDSCGAAWHLKRVYEELADGVKVSLTPSSLLIEFENTSSALCFSYNAGVLTIT